MNKKLTGHTPGAKLTLKTAEAEITPCCGLRGEASTFRFLNVFNFAKKEGVHPK
ncbi:hypothetical protein [Serratia aquatilis]|uniref:Uncharacterized protein n=1 Tax=Serratia aquatilis TaxID=1737515 RepID=A0ABV6EBE4_9GAMM